MYVHQPILLLQSTVVMQALSLIAILFVLVGAENSPLDVLNEAVLQLNSLSLSGSTMKRAFPDCALLDGTTAGTCT